MVRNIDQGKGKVALVTGAGNGAEGGIGAGIARTLAAYGYHVAVNDLSAESIARTVAQIEESGGTASAAPFDVTRSEQVSDAVARVAEQTGRLDVVVNNAGIVGVHSVAETTDEEWNRVLGINLTGPFFVSRAALPHLIDAGMGRIVNIASIAGIRIGGLGGAVYTASKSGLLGFTRHLAAEVGTRGVTVNAVCPGLTLSPLIADRTTPETLAELTASVPTRTSGLPDDIGEVVAFLASPQAHYIHGQAIVHDGGKTLLQGDFAGWLRTSGIDIAERSDI